MVSQDLSVDWYNCRFPYPLASGLRVRNVFIDRVSLLRLISRLTFSGCTLFALPFRPENCTFLPSSRISRMRLFISRAGGWVTHDLLSLTKEDLELRSISAELVSIFSPFPLFWRVRTSPIGTPCCVVLIGMWSTLLPCLGPTTLRQLYSQSLWCQSKSGDHCRRPLFLFVTWIWLRCRDGQSLRWSVPIISFSTVLPREKKSPIGL